ncbi:2308_t:CDS:2, partial [Racocetra fulgida]
MANRKDFEIPITDENDVLQITALGAGNELDAGIHPAYNGLAALPFYDEIDPATVDVLLIKQDLLHSYDKIEAVDYHQEVEVEGIKFTSYNAGHVLGAAMFLIEIAGVKAKEDRHLMAAELPPAQPDVLITESTYGVQNHEPRLEKYK